MLKARRYSMRGVVCTANGAMAPQRPTTLAEHSAVVSRTWNYSDPLLVMRSVCMYVQVAAVRAVAGAVTAHVSTGARP